MMAMFALACVSRIASVLEIQGRFRTRMHRVSPFPGNGSGRSPVGAEAQKEVKRVQIQQTWKQCARPGARVVDCHGHCTEALLFLLIAGSRQAKKQHERMYGNPATGRHLIGASPAVPSNSG
jgi:hypothetical protein